MNKTLLCAAAGALALAPLAAQAQSAGSNVVTLGWFHVMPQQSSTPMTTNVAPTPINTPLRLPPTFTSPGTGLRTSGADTVGLTVSHFLTDHIAVTSVAGVPPVFKVSGQGTIRPPGPAGALGTQNIGLASVNPIVKSVRQWSPAVLLQYYFGAATAKFRPFLGLGVSYNWFQRPAAQYELHQADAGQSGRDSRGGRGQAGDDVGGGEGFVVVAAGVQRGLAVQLDRALRADRVGDLHPAEDDVDGDDQGRRRHGARGVEIGAEGGSDHQLRRDDVQVLMRTKPDETGRSCRKRQPASKNAGKKKPA